MQNVHGFTLSMEMEYLLRNKLIIFIAPMTLPRSRILKTGGMNEDLRIISSVPSGSTMAKSAFLNGFRKPLCGGLLLDANRPRIPPKSSLNSPLQ
jgi:hypothetical protein